MKNKKVIIFPMIILVLVLIIGAVFTYLALATDTFKNKKELFLSYLVQNKELLSFFESDELKLYEEKQNNHSYVTEGNIQSKIKYIDSQIDDFTDTTLDNTITFIGNVDNPNNYVYQNVNINYSDSQSLNIELLKKGDVYAAKVNDVLNMFIGIENNNLKDFATRMGINGQQVQNIPNKIDFANIQSLFNIFTDEEKSELEKKYYKILFDSIPNDKISKADNIYTLKLKRAELNQIINKLLSALKEDELIKTKLKNKLVTDFVMLDNDAETLLLRLQDSIQSQIESNNTLKETDNEISIKVYTQGNKLLKTEIIGETQLSLKKTEDGFNLEYLNPQEFSVPYVYTFRKVATVNQVKYSLIETINDTKMLDYSINFTGLNSNTIIENSEFYIMRDLDEYTYIYNNKKNFEQTSTGITINDENIRLLNTAPNREAILNFYEQFNNRFAEVNNQKMTAAGIDAEAYDLLSIFSTSIEQISLTYGFSHPSKIATILPIIGVEYLVSYDDTIMADYYNEDYKYINENEKLNVKLDIEDLLNYFVVQNEQVGIVLSKENLESALSDLGATITENADKTFTVTINETGNIYIISSAGKMLKYQFKGEEMKDEPEEIEDDSYVEPTEEVTE